MEIIRQARLANLPALREFVGHACQQAGADSSTCFALELAVEEACANIVIHGYAGREPGPIIVAFERDAQEAVVTITDYGRAFSPDQAPAPDLLSGWEERRVGGLGVHLMRAMVDEMSYRSDSEEGNQLTLRKRINRVEQG